MKRGVGLAVLGIILILNVKAQQTPVYSQYMFNKFLTNPAIAGSEGYSAVNVTAREQWLGVKDAPKTHSLSYQTRLNPKSFLNRISFLRNKYSRPSRMGNVGLGLYLYNDNRGVIDQTGLQCTYAYHIEMDEIQLSFGLTASVTQFSINRNKLLLFDVTDDLISNTNLKTYYPDMSFGVYVTSPEYYAGFSVTDMMQSSIKFNNSGLNNYRKLRNYNLSGGYRFKMDRDYSFEPSANFKTTEQFNYQLDVAARVYYQNSYWGGIGVRTGGAMFAMAGIKYDNFYFGYAYDYSFNALQTSSIGSHELMITYKFGNVYRKFKWLERF
jgi:type IX secretion system PorP/SprF family membrane protein